MIKQHIYHGGSATAESLADFLVQQYEHDQRWQAQKLGEGKSFIVQVARRDPDHASEKALTIGITPSSETASDLTVTMGSQEWLHSNISGYGVVGTLIGALFTPWALFGLIWPITEALSGHSRPEQTWELIDTYMLSKGASLAQQQDLTHPYHEPPTP